MVNFKLLLIVFLGPLSIKLKMFQEMGGILLIMVVKPLKFKGSSFSDIKHKMLLVI